MAGRADGYVQDTAVPLRGTGGGRGPRRRPICGDPGHESLEVAVGGVAASKVGVATLVNGERGCSRRAGKAGDPLRPDAFPRCRELEDRGAQAARPGGRGGNVDDAGGPLDCHVCGRVGAGTRPAVARRPAGRACRRELSEIHVVPARHGGGGAHEHDVARAVHGDRGRPVVTGSADRPLPCQRAVRGVLQQEDVARGSLGDGRRCSHVQRAVGCSRGRDAAAVRHPGRREELRPQLVAGGALRRSTRPPGQGRRRR